MSRILTLYFVLLLMCAFFPNDAKALEQDDGIATELSSVDAFDNLSEDIGISRFVENSPYGWIDAAPGVREYGEENYLVEEYVIDEHNDYFCVVDGVLYSKDMSILYLYPPLKKGWYFQIPATVHTIEGCAFKGSVYLEELVIPESVINLDGDDTFTYSSVEVIHFPRSIEALDTVGFYHLPCIKKLIIQQGSIVEYEFMLLQDYIDYTDMIFAY